MNVVDLQPLFDRLDVAVEEKSVFSVDDIEDEAIVHLSARDAVSDEAIDYVTAFRLSDSTLWILDKDAWVSDPADSESQAHVHKTVRSFYILDRQSGRKWYSRA